MSEREKRTASLSVKSLTKINTPKSSSPQKSLRGEISCMEVPDDEEVIMQNARDMVKEQLNRKQETIQLSNGEYLHRSHVVLIVTVDGIPVTTYLAINSKSKDESSRIVTHEIKFNDERIQLKQPYQT